MRYELKKKFRLVKKFYKRTFGKPKYKKIEKTVKGKTIRIIDKVSSGELMRKALITNAPIKDEQVPA